jgi:hypothetical protein
MSTINKLRARTMPLNSQLLFIYQITATPDSFTIDKMMSWTRLEENGAGGDDLPSPEREAATWNG